MTADEFGTVDVDLLADYIGDALDGPDHERVARLVADDPEWRSAYALLSPGMDSVSAELSAMGSAPEQMPDDLWVRLDDAFRSPIADPSTIPADLATPAEPHLEPVRADRHLVSVPTEVSAPTEVSVPTERSERKNTSRRRRLRWAAPIAAAAGVVAFAGFGAAYLSNSKSSQDNATSSAAGAADMPQNAPEIASAGGASGLVDGPFAGQVSATGTNYSERSLRNTVPFNNAAPKTADDGPLSAPPAQEQARTGGAMPVLPADPGLSRLGSSDALRACLEAIANQNGAGRITVQSIDYARFNAAPALIVRFTAEGVTQSWATGPDCGASGRGAQVRKAVQVG
ncbi:hypothetical protein [Actinoplanes sp. NPDC089786]|uniref:hypothetical protein n=1 Tax=Actinoplanes sp. NPDC089786 TaxID=3155185 RepID=UPI00342BA781